MIALTGGAASGKSFVLAILSELGYKTISADEVVAKLWQNSAIRADVSKRLGLPEPFDNADVREKIFGDAQARRKLNKIFHGPVMRTILDSGADFAEVPLLVETCSHNLFSEAWLVTCGESEQRARLLERGLNQDQIEKILSLQLSDRVKSQFCSQIIRTNDSRDRVIGIVKQRLQAISRVHPQ